LAYLDAEVNDRISKGIGATMLRRIDGAFDVAAGM
jgi:hypothetical protein